MTPSKKDLYIGEQEFSNLNQLAMLSVTDLAGNIIFANESLCRFTGYSREELLGQNHRILNSGYHDPIFFKHLWNNILSQKPWHGQIKNKRKNGEIYWVRTTIIPIIEGPIIEGNDKVSKYLAICFDITVEKLLEEAIDEEKQRNIQISRLSVLGEMASGIAHEINNPLAVIIGLLEQNDRKLESGDVAAGMPKILENNAKIKKQIFRISKIVKGLGEFSQSGDHEVMERVSIKSIIDSVRSLCEERLKKISIKLETEIIECELNCRAVQIEQVVFNLINNSIDALGELNIPEKWIKIDIRMRGGYLEIGVTDSGSGIMPEVAKKIMQPFFTTKAVGKGIGLGLSISKGIIESHGGSLSLDPNSKNTRFAILIPKNDSALLELLNVEEAISAHLAWKQKLYNHITNQDNLLDPDKVSSDCNCSLGQWILKIESRFKANASFIELKDSHTEFHKYAGDIVRRVATERTVAAEVLFESGSDYDRLSKRVIVSLQCLRAYIQNKNEP